MNQQKISTLLRHVVIVAAICTPVAAWSGAQGDKQNDNHNEYRPVLLLAGAAAAPTSDSSASGNQPPPPEATGAPGSSTMAGSGQEASESSATGAAGADRLPGTATGAQEASSGASSEVSLGDRSMMEEMALANHAEIAAARLALAKSKSPEVQKFAQKMIDDHGKTLSQLQTLAGSKDVDLPTKPDAQHQSALKKLEGQSDTDFDQGYLKQNVTDHRNTLRQLRRVSESAGNPELKSMAARLLPVIEEHLMMAERMAGIDSKSQPRDMQPKAPAAR